VKPFWKLGPDSAGNGKQNKSDAKYDHKGCEWFWDLVGQEHGGQQRNDTD